MQNPISILSTKVLLSPQKQALLNEGFLVTEANFIKTENSDFDLKGINDNLIFTSQNAAQSVLLHPKWEGLKKKKCVLCRLENQSVIRRKRF